MRCSRRRNAISSSRRAEVARHFARELSWAAVGRRALDVVRRGPRAPPKLALESGGRGTLTVTLGTAALTPLTLADLARCGGGRLAGADRIVDSISIDSRTLTAGALFVALKGEQVDGHEFAAAAAARGACGLLVERELPIALPQVVVPDTLGALTACARARRRAFAGPVIAVTGSNGKTTTKEMIGAILAVRGPCLITKGNLNNHIGVPLTLLRLRAEHRYAVIEMGANHRGEIAHLAVDCRARHRHRHQRGCRAPRRIRLARRRRRGQRRAVRGAAARRRCRRQRRRSVRAAMAVAVGAGRRITTFGLDSRPTTPREASDRRCGTVRPRLEFELVAPGGTVRVELALAGMHNLRNALGAAAAAQAAGASLDDVAAGLGAVRPVKGRLEFRPAVNGAVLVDDSYNANPGSLQSRASTRSRRSPARAGWCWAT